jgi:hypothetical protein
MRKYRIFDPELDIDRLDPLIPATRSELHAHRLDSDISMGGFLRAGHATTRRCPPPDIGRRT